ncbi:MAG TPA: hypothetical protein DC054_16865 [Blastocatellia bacterium]|nr:hypothetical protein [Blastocatellia bacterium]
MESPRHVWLIVLLLVGVIVPDCKQRPTTDPGIEILKESARRGDEAYRKYRTADYQTAKAALQDYLQFLDKISDDPNGGDMARTDAEITCVRLAKLEEKNHGPDETKYMKEAVARCEKRDLKFRGCAEDYLRKDVDRMDQVPPK